MWKIIKVITPAVLLVLAILLTIAGYQYYMVFGGGGATFDKSAPILPEKIPQPAVLIFSKTNSYRHDSIPVGNKALETMARKLGWGVFVTENAAVFNSAQLARFKVVVWNNVSGDVLLPDQKESFRDYLENGGGLVAIHAAGDSSHTWPWYKREVLGNAQFIGHTLFPQLPRAVVVIEDRSHPATAHLPPRWSRNDEWYSFAESPRGLVHVLAALDETSYTPDDGLIPGDLRMGKDHPVVWCRNVGKGRTLYSALGHTEQSYREVANLRLLLGAMTWAAGVTNGFCGT